MPVIQRKISLAAGTATANLLAGSAYEFLRRRSVVSVGILCSQVGGLVSFSRGSDLVLEESPPFIGTDYPIIPDQMYYTTAGEMGDRLTIPARNTAGTATDFFVVAQIAEV